MPIAALIYLHGFASSPLSHKSCLLKHYLSSRPVDPALPDVIDFYAPQLPVSPVQAIAGIESLISSLSGQKVALVGSSLGGFYALNLSQRLALPAVLINPAVYPYHLLTHYLGENQNYHTGETFHLDERHMQELLALEVGELPHPEKVYLLQQTGDETLDYREAVARLEGCKTLVEEGGSHGFDRFESHISQVLSFCFQKN